MRNGKAHMDVRLGSKWLVLFFTAAKGSVRSAGRGSAADITMTQRCEAKIELKKQEKYLILLFNMRA
jgi:hypothetical protein